MRMQLELEKGKIKVQELKWDVTCPKISYTGTYRTVPYNAEA